MVNDFIIIGGGLIGMLVARELRAAGASVSVLERGHCGREASWAGGGILSPLYPWRFPGRAVLAAWGQHAYPGLATALAEESGTDPELTLSGMLIVDAADRAEALAWAAQHKVRIETPGPARAGHRAGIVLCKDRCSGYDGAVDAGHRTGA